MEPLINCLFIVSISGSMTPFVYFFTNVYLHLNSKCSFLRLQKPPEDVDSETRPCADIPLWTPKTVVLANCCEQRDNTESPCCLGQLLEWRWGGGVAFPNNITLEDQPSQMCGATLLPVISRNFDRWSRLLTTLPPSVFGCKSTMQSSEPNSELVHGRRASHLSK